MMKNHARLDATPEERVRGFLRRFRASLKRDGISAGTAEFKDRKVETAYRRFLVNNQLKTERLYWWATIIAFLLYLILDLTTITRSLTEIIALRIVVATFCASMIPLSYVERFKPYFSYLTVGGMLAFALSIIAMISMMQSDDAPPYIIGVLVTFIASSCLMRIPFRLAASVYIGASIVYLLVLNLDSDFHRSDIIAGHFFMISIALVAVVTNYAQEIRSRQIWLRDEQRQRDAEMIEKLLIEATAADQSKINFLSMMSHELRTPLHQIIGYTEVVANSCKAANDMDDNVRHLNEIHGSAHVLLSRIQKMLRFVDATAGKMKYEMVDTPVSELVDVALERMRAGLEKKAMRVDTSGLVDSALYIDIVHTCYAVNNLIENAINASSEGSTLWISGDKTADGAYELILRDEGSGMSEEQIAGAFKPFTQTENTLVRSGEGLSLGLTLARRIFEDQRASITLLSDGEHGTTVKIRFEAREKEQKPARDKAAG
ncbi:sensor histidine kinase [Hyphococcus luteus]|nr:HAMP domain-containing sensor histidine kinase [Marinicaulis flavus]